MIQISFLTWARWSPAPTWELQLSEARCPSQGDPGSDSPASASDFAAGASPLKKFHPHCRRMEVTAPSQTGQWWETHGLHWSPSCGEFGVSLLGTILTWQTTQDSLRPPISFHIKLSMEHFEHSEKIEGNSIRDLRVPITSFISSQYFANYFTHFCSSLRLLFCFWLKYFKINPGYHIIPPNAGDPDVIPGSGRCPGEADGNPLQYSCLENPMVRGAWWATVHGVAKSRTWLSD